MNAQSKVRDKLLTLLDTTELKLRGTPNSCTYDCDSMYLGALLKHRTRTNTACPTPDPPYRLCPSYLVKCISEFRSPRLCPRKDCQNIKWFVNLECDAKDEEEKLQGLSLNDYLDQ